MQLKKIYFQKRIQGSDAENSAWDCEKKEWNIFCSTVILALPITVQNSWSAGNPGLCTCLTSPQSFNLKSNFIKSCSVQSERVIDAKTSLFLEERSS